MAAPNPAKCASEFLQWDKLSDESKVLFWEAVHLIAALVGQPTKHRDHLTTEHSFPADSMLPKDLERSTKAYRKAIKEYFTQSDIKPWTHLPRILDTKRNDVFKTFRDAVMYQVARALSSHGRYKRILLYGDRAAGSLQSGAPILSPAPSTAAGGSAAEVITSMIDPNELPGQSRHLEDCAQVLEDFHGYLSSFEDEGLDDNRPLPVQILQGSLNQSVVTYNEPKYGVPSNSAAPMRDGTLDGYLLKRPATQSGTPVDSLLSKRPATQSVAAVSSLLFKRRHEDEDDEITHSPIMIRSRPSIVIAGAAAASENAQNSNRSPRPRENLIRKRCTGRVASGDRCRREILMYGDKEYVCASHKVKARWQKRTDMSSHGRNLQVDHGTSRHVQ